LQKRYGSHNNGNHGFIINLEHFIRRVANSRAGSAEYDSGFIEQLPCYVGWLFARVMPNGDVNSCLKSHRFPIGNIHSQSFAKIWNSEKQFTFRTRALSANKDDPFFALIGNDPGCAVGCRKSCDDLGRNLRMHERIESLSFSQKTVLKAAARLMKGKTW
jgi:sulfatase maturation enzyme AslB (radical SAM superfamily)